jgi:hypothetical protein
MARISQRDGTQHTMSYDLAAAAAATGLNKASILRAIKSGKISGTKDALGQWWVEPAELHRVAAAPARAHGRLVPRHVAGRGAIRHALRYCQRDQGQGCGLVSSRIHGLDRHLGSLSG